MSKLRGAVFVATYIQTTLEADDASGNGNTAMFYPVTNAPTLTAAPTSGWGNALTLSTAGATNNSTAACVWISGGRPLTKNVWSGAFAVELFQVKRSRTSHSVTEVLFAKEANLGANNTIVIHFQTGNKIGVNYWDSAGVPTAGLLSTNTFASTTDKYDIAVTYDGTTIRLWVSTNGGTPVLEASAALSGGCRVATDNYAPILIGRNRVDGGFAGQISCLRISKTSRGGASWATLSSPPSTDSDTLCLLQFDANTTGTSTSGTMDLFDTYNSVVVGGDLTSGTMTGNSGIGAQPKVFQLQPTAGSQTLTATALATQQANNKGWHIQPTLGMGSVSGATRRLRAGDNNIFRGFFSSLVGLTGNAWFIFDLYKRASGGGLTFLREDVSSALAASAIGTSGQVSITYAIPSDITFAAGETLYIEVYVSIPGQTVTATTAVAQLRPESDFWGIGAEVGGNNGGFAYQFTQSPSETTSVSETTSRVVVHPRSTTETTTVSETTTRGTIAARSSSETTVVSETTTRQFTGFRSTSETTSVSETSTRQFTGFRSTSETTTVSETSSRNFNGARATTETLTTSETPSRIAAFPRSTSDSVTTSETASRLVVFNRSTSESTSLSETTSRAFTGSRTANETSVVSETSSRLLTYGRTTNEYPPGLTPDWPVVFPTRMISGIVRDVDTGDLIEGATVKLVRDEDEFWCQTALSAVDGSFSFTRDLFDPYVYHVYAYGIDGALLQIHGVSDRELSPDDGTTPAPVLVGTSVFTPSAGGTTVIFAVLD